MRTSSLFPPKNLHKELRYKLISCQLTSKRMQPGKLDMSNLNAWRFASDFFPFQLGVIFGFLAEFSGVYLDVPGS